MNVSILTTEGEYLKLCDVKAYLKVSGTDRDGFIVNCINTAVEYVEKVIKVYKASKVYKVDKV